MRIAICDDELSVLAELREMLDRYDTMGALQIFSYQSAQKLYLDYEKQNFDIAIMDIEMEAPNGYEIAKRLVEYKPAPIVIFLTKSMAYSIRGYGIAFRYLTKPLDEQTLIDTLAVATAEVKAKRYTFSVDGTSRIICLDDIYYFEVFNHHTVLHTMDKAYTYRATLREVCSELPLGYFGSPHQSYIVNFAHISTATSKEIHLTNGSVIPVSRRKQHEFESLLHAYLRR